MSVWIRIFNPTYTVELGDGPVRLESVTLNRKLDEIGDCSITLSGIDIRAISLIEPRRVIEIWHQELGFAKRRVGTFVVEGEADSDADAKTWTVSGRSTAVALADKLVLSGPGAIYQEETFGTVANDLCALAGWTANVDDAVINQLISVPFTDDKVLRALQTLSEIKGVHLRESKTIAKQIDIGAFGTNEDNIYIKRIEGDNGEIHRQSTSPLLIERATISRESSDIWNWAKVFAGGDGDAALDISLAMPTRSFIDSIFINGRTHYFIKDNASIARYGQIEKRVDVQRIIPVANTDDALIAAAEAAADAAKATLDRHAEPQTVISLSLRNVRTTVSPGDKVHLTYKGVMNKNGIPYKYRDIDDDFWVMQVTEQITASGITLVLEVSNIDRYQTNAAGIIVGMMDDIQVQKVDVKPYPIMLPWVSGNEPMDTSTPVEFKFPMFDNVLRHKATRMFIVRDNWTAVAGVAQDGGDHRHLMMELVGVVGTPPPNADWTYYQTKDGNEDSSNDKTIYIPVAFSANATDLWTFEGSGDHTHDTEFNEVKTDNQLPETLSVVVNGTLAASGLFPGGNTDDIAEIDITDEVNGKVGGFRGFHEVTINCSAGRGELFVVVLMEVDIGKVRVA